jgi:hypothetical protein
VIAWLLSCSREPATPSAPTPAPAPVAPTPEPAAPSAPERAPDVVFHLPDRDGKTPAPIALTPALAKTRATLEKVVVDHARDPSNPWAIVHAMLALGPTMKLDNGADPVDWMFEHYADVAKVGDQELIAFPATKDGALVEPHTDLILKALTETGVHPDRKVHVGGREFEVADLYRHSLWESWVGPTGTGYQDGQFNDTPWALQALSAWAPADLAWQAEGDHEMTMSAFTDQVVATLGVETREMQAAEQAGQLVQKDTRKGLFRYTCGGQHLLQGAAYAVGRGFGSPSDRQAMCDQLALLRWRIDVELGAIDPILTRPGVDPNVQLVLLSQRLKFLGHWLETTHKFGALGVCPLGDADRAASERVANELARTVDALGQLGIWSDVGAVRQNKVLDTLRPSPNGGANQVYLDLVGDSAHAVHGIDLATGKASIAY